MQNDLAAIYLKTDTKPNGFVISGLGPLNRWRHQLELTLKGKNRCLILSYDPMILRQINDRIFGTRFLWKNEYMFMDI